MVVREQPALVDARVCFISALAILIAFGAGLVARALTGLIGFFTNLAFYGRFSTAFVSPAHNQLGLGVIAVAVAGGLVVGMIARFGSKAIRGHGIPEAMEQVLTNQSRIPARMIVLKPLSSAIAIGTGGPFGAEGPIIATGAALGSQLGQLLKISAMERKTLLAAGAAAGMAATFASPVSAVLLAIELLLFEYRPRSLIPVSLAAAVATGVHMALMGSAPIFAMPVLAQPSGAALAAYVVLGAVVGVVSVAVTRAVYAIEDAFEKLPLHWMWWPAIGALCVGVIGCIAPRTLGVGYDNIEQIISGQMLPASIAILCTLKFVSWAIALGSGTSGGTLAPLFTLGGGLGALLGAGVAALVGMAAMFAGASRALLASVVFAFETTRQPMGLLPLLGGCTAAFMTSCLLMENSIMTEKIVRRGIRASGEYSADFLDQLNVRDYALRRVITLQASSSVASVRAWLASAAEGSRHQGFPVVDEHDELVGVLTRKDLFDAHTPDVQLSSLLTRSPTVIYDDHSFRDAANCMAQQGIGRLPVVTRAQPRVVIGIITRSDLVDAHARRLAEHNLEPNA